MLILSKYFSKIAFILDCTTYLYTSSYTIDSLYCCTRLSNCSVFILLSFFN
nr:MAG TPA: hypothetical protein [Crassvirales sp.]